jgi:hypothetical protein
MGNNNSGTITINLDRNDLFYFTNEIISGKVNINIQEEKLEVNKIFLTLIGEIGYTTTINISGGIIGAMVQTEYNHIPFYSIKIPFQKSKNEENKIILYKGKHSWSFKIPLINSLLPSINKTESFPRVRYYLEVVIDKPWYKAQGWERKYLTIFPHVNLLKNPQCLLSYIFGNSNKQDIHLRSTINKLGYVPNESINILLEIHNPQKVLIKHINLKVFQFYQIGPNTCQNILFQGILPKISNLKDERIKETFSILIPSNPIPPTYQLRGKIKGLVVVNISYMLRLTAKVEGIFTNINADIPIIIGTQPHPDLNQQATSNSSIVAYSLDTAQSMFKNDDDDDPPPSYESVVQTTMNISSFSL